MTHHVSSIKTYLIIFGVLMALLGLTIAISFIDFGFAPLNIGIALLIAATKAVLVVLFFMHLRGGSRLSWAFAAAGFLWLGILLVLTMSDYLARGWGV